MFDKDMQIHGKYATYWKALTQLPGNAVETTKNFKIFENYIYVYMVAPIIGLLNGRKGYYDPSDDSKDTAGMLAEIQIKNIVIGFIVATVLVTGMILMAPYRIDRIISFLDPWNDPLGSGFQIIQSLYAISPASLFGYGLFNSRQKYFYLPEPQNDFIFAIIIEELGIMGGLILLSLFSYLIYTGYKLSKNLDDLFSSYLVFGITSLLLVQVFINIAVVIGLIPVAGVTLPLVSYGGSSLVITMYMLGIVVNVIKDNSNELI
jgi:cell division protein FtsW